MDQLGHSGCVNNLIDQINRDLSDKFSLKDNSKCDYFTSDLMECNDRMGCDDPVESTFRSSIPSSAIKHSLGNDILSMDNTLSDDHTMINHSLAYKPVDHISTTNINLTYPQLDANRQVNDSSMPCFIKYNNNIGDLQTIDTCSTKLNNEQSVPSDMKIDLKSNFKVSNQTVSTQFMSAQSVSNQTVSIQPIFNQSVENTKLIDKPQQEENNLIDQLKPMRELSSFTCNSSMNKEQNAAKHYEELKKDKTILNGQQEVANCKSPKNCKCQCVPRYSRLIHELPSFEIALKHDTSYSNKEPTRLQNVLHLIHTKEQCIAQLNATGKQVELTSIQSNGKHHRTRLTDFDAIVESGLEASISNDFYLDLSRTVLPDLIQNCLNGNDALLIQTGSSESHNVLLGPKGLFSFAINWLFDALERSHSKFVVRSTAAQFDSEQLIDLFAKHKLSRAPSRSSRFLNGKSILNNLNEIRCSTLKRSAQAIELAINNHRKLINLTSSNENVLLITFHIYQYEVKKIASDSGRTAIGGCSRFHLLDIGSNFESISNILSSLLNENTSLDKSRRSLSRTNKMWPKFNDESKLGELFHEFINDSTCLLSAVGSFENKQSNYRCLNAFCDLAEQMQKSKCKRTATLNRSTVYRNGRDQLSCSNEYLMSKSLRRNSIKYHQSMKSNCLRSLKYDQNSTSLPRRLSGRYGRKNEESKENVKKIVFKRQHLQISQTEEQWIDGPNCKLTDNESECSINNSSIHNSSSTNNNYINQAVNASSKSSSTSRSNEANAGLIRQKRIENWIRQQQMSEKSKELLRTLNCSKNGSKSSSSKINCHLDDYVNNKVDETVLDKFTTLNSQLSNLYNTIAHTTGQRSTSRTSEQIDNDLNQNNNLTNLNSKESPFKYLTATGPSRREHRNCVLNQLALKTNYQEQFKLTSSEDDWSSKDDEDDEQKLIEENLHFFSASFFRRNFQLSPTTLSDDGKSSIYTGGDLVPGKRTKQHQRKLSMDVDLEKLDDLDKNERADDYDLKAEPPKQLKLEQFLKQLISSTVSSQPELNNIGLSSLESTKKMSIRLNKVDSSAKPHFKRSSPKTTTTKSTSSSTSSSGVHLSSSKDVSTKDTSHFDLINSKLDSIKSYDDSYVFKDVVSKNSSATSSGHGTSLSAYISEAESGQTNVESKNDKYTDKVSSNFKRPPIIPNNKQQPKSKSSFEDEKSCRVVSLEPKSSFKSKSFKNTELVSNGSLIVCKPIKEPKSQNLFCCGLF